MRKTLFLLLVAAAAAVHAAGPENTLLPSGDFEAGSLGSNNWTSGKGVSIEEEDGNRFLRVTNEDAGVQVQSYRKIEVPPGTKSVKVSFRVRFVDIVTGAENWHTGRVVMHFKDSNGAMLKPDPKPFAFKGKSDGWMEKSVDLDVPQGTTAMEILVALFQAQGTLDIDDFVVTPQD